MHRETPTNPSFIPVNIHGGIGDTVQAIDMIHWLNKRYQCIFYVPHGRVLSYFAPNLKNVLVKKCPDESYTWSLEIDSYVYFKFRDNFGGFLLDDHKQLYNQTYKLTKTGYNDIAKHAKALNLRRQEYQFFCLGVHEWKADAVFRSLTALDGKEARNRAPLDQVTIHDGYDTQYKKEITTTCMKQWPLDHWNRLVRGLKGISKTTRVVQLGSSTSRRIEGVDECLIDKTTIESALDVISRSRLHIDGDSGLAHAAARLGVPGITIFGPTPNAFYGYKQNVNLRSERCEPCFWTKPDWMKKCPKGFDEPLCMKDIDPGMVLREAERFLK